MKNSCNISFFNSENKIIRNIVEDSNGELCLINNENQFLLTHKKSGSSILILNEGNEKTISNLYITEVKAQMKQDIRILRYLFKKYSILFYDESFDTYVEMLDRIKDRKFWINERNSYAVELMMHYGVIRDIPELEKILNTSIKNFVDETIMEKSQIIQYKRIKKLLYITKIKMFFTKIKSLFTKKK